MRNYNSKSHIPPLPVNSFKKSDRLYPEPIDLKENSLINKQCVKQNKIKNDYMQQPKKHHFVPVIITANSRQSQNYSLLLQQNFMDLVDKNKNSHQNTIQNDGTCLWFTNIPKNMYSSPNILKFNNLKYILSNWTSDLFPNIMYICIDGVSGLTDKFGAKTNRVASLKLANITRVDDSGMKYYQLIYTTQQQFQWELPQSLTYLYMSMRLDQQQQAIVLPLPQPIVIEMQIKNENKL